MEQIRLNHAQANLKYFFNKVVRGQKYLITRDKDEQVVLISEAEYKGLVEAKKKLDYLEASDKQFQEATGWWF